MAPERVSEMTNSLKRNCSPGIDGITAELLKYWKSDYLCCHLSALYSAIFYEFVVPFTFTMRVKVLVLKKVDPNNACNYCCITEFHSCKKY